MNKPMKKVFIIMGGACLSLLLFCTSLLVYNVILKNNMKERESFFIESTEKSSELYLQDYQERYLLINEKQAEEIQRIKKGFPVIRQSTKKGVPVYHVDTKGMSANEAAIARGKAALSYIESIHGRAIEFWSKYYRVDPDLVRAMYSIESRGDTLAFSGSGAMGAAQILPRTSMGLGLYDPAHLVRPDTAAKYCAKYVRQGMEYSYVNTDSALVAGYHNGYGSEKEVKKGLLYRYRHTFGYNHVRKVMAVHAFIKSFETTQEPDSIGLLAER